MRNKDLPPLLTRGEAAKLVSELLNIPCSKQKLATWAHEGRGPPYHRVGRWPLYPKADLVAWAKRQLGPRFPRRAAAQSDLSINP
jgi:hypothetical protein